MKAKFAFIILIIIALVAALIFSRQTDKSETPTNRRKEILEVPIESPVVPSIAPTPAPKITLTLDDPKLIIADPLAIVPTKVVQAATPIPALIKELSRFDVTVDDKKNPIVHYQFWGEATPEKARE